MLHSALHAAVWIGAVIFVWAVLLAWAWSLCEAAAQADKDFERAANSRAAHDPGPEGPVDCWDRDRRVGNDAQSESQGLPTLSYRAASVASAARDEGRDKPSSRPPANSRHQRIHQRCARRRERRANRLAAV